MLIGVLARWPRNVRVLIWTVWTRMILPTPPQRHGDVSVNRDMSIGMTNARKVRVHTRTLL